MSLTTFTQFTEERLDNFITAVINTTMFLPHFFSVKHLLKTFFAPWKNLSQQSGTGKSLNDTLSRISFNLISRFVGMGVRCAVITLYLLIQIIFVLLLPIIFTLFILFLPFRYFLPSSDHEGDEKKKKDDFISSHTLDPNNREKVEKWYTTIIMPQNVKTPWYDEQKLFRIPPFARDWTAGYTPTMDQFCNSIVPDNQDTHLIGRVNELSQMEHTLLMTQNANLLLVGDEGVGRETIIKFFAQKIYYGSISPALAYKRVLTIDLQKILSVSTDQITRLNTLSTIFKEANDAGNIILVIHDLDKFVSTLEGHIDCSDILSQYAKSNKINIVATTTPANYQKHIYSNAKIHELFTKIDIVPIPVNISIAILLDLASHIEEKYHITIPYETIVETVTKADQFIGYLPLPESAINVLNETSSILSSDRSTKILTPAMITNHLEQKLHVPTSVTERLKTKLLTLESELEQHIIAQHDAILTLSAGLKNAFLAGKRAKKPLSTFLFLGPTGVGKTETAKALSQIFFEDKKALIRLDMANFQTSQDVNRLLGDNDNPGLLTQMVRSQPYGVLLLDEIEKSIPDLLNIFLSILDEGYFTDGKGERVDCQNLIIIATSNAGADFIFEKLAKNQALTPDQLINELINNKIYTPEFINRFDAVVVFQPLRQTAITTIATKLLKTLDGELFDAHGVHVEVSPQTLSDLITKNYNPVFGARDLKRIIDFEIKEKISSKILGGNIEKGTTISL